MFTGKLSSIPNIQGGYIRVAHPAMSGVTDFGPVDLSSPPKGVMHTTEGTQEIPAYGSNAPQLTIGKHGIYQHRDFGRMAGTVSNHPGGVETNRLCRIQFELVEFTEREPWLPESQFQQDALASVFEWAWEALGVPQKHVWPDIQGSGILATESYYRRYSRFPGVAGWYNHGEMPENAHWDMGSCQATKLMDRKPGPEMVTAHALYVNWTGGQGHSRSKRLSEFYKSDKLLRSKLAVDGKVRGDLWRALNGKVVIDGKTVEVKRARPHIVTKKIVETRVGR